MKSKSPQQDNHKNSIKAVSKTVDIIEDKNNSIKTMYSIKIVMLVSVLLLVFAVGSFCTYNYFNSSRVDNIDMVCAQDEELIRSSAGAIAKSSKDELKQYVDVVKSLKGNETDQNCLYIYLNYFLLEGDLNNSKIEYDNFIAIYKTENDKFNEFGLRVTTNKQLESNVKFLSKFDNELVENARIRGQNVGNQ